MNPPAGEKELIDSILEQFRSAKEFDPGSRLPIFALAPDHPQYLPLIVALIHFDRQWHARRGDEKVLGDYWHDYPELARDPRVVNALVALEAPAADPPVAPDPVVPDPLHSSLLWHPSANRLACSEVAGEPERFRIPNDASAGGGPAGPFDIPSLREAAEAYQQFRAAGGEDEKQLTALFKSARVHAETVDVFRDMHRSDPAFAARLAQATLAMPAAGRDIPGFRLLDEIGRGAFGRVFLALQTELANRRVVLKVTAELPGESQTLAQLQHTNIVPIYSVHALDSLVALCMPFFGTTTLADVIGGLQGDHPLPVSGRHLVTTLNSRRKVSQLLSTPTEKVRAVPVLDPKTSIIAGDSATPPLAAVPAAPERHRVSTLLNLEGFSYVNAILWIGARLADGLDHAHQRGILHRDLKPANVLLTDDGQPMLLDFNLSEDTKLRASASAARAGGTLPYMSPEQLEAFRDGGALDERSDLYSLGLVLYELLTGRHAFPLHDGAASEVVVKCLADRQSARLSLRAHNPRVSPAAEAIVLRCLEFDRTKRYRSARALQEDIERHLADRPLKHLPEPSLRERVAKWRRRHPRLTSSTTAGAVCLAVLLAGGAFLGVRMRQVRQLEARDALDGFRKQVLAAKYLLNKSAPDPTQVADGIRAAAEALNTYEVLDRDDVDDLPGARDLPDADRLALAGEIRETLLLLARAETVQAMQQQDRDQRQRTAEHALHLVELAAAKDADGAESKVSLLQRAELTDLLGRADEARRLTKEADARSPQTASEFYLLALRLGDRHEFARALPLLRESTRLDPRDVWAWFYQGYCHSQRAEFLDAVRCYTACIAVAPRHTNTYLPYFNRGLAYAQLGLYPEACADFDEAGRLRPGVADVSFNRGIARLEWKKYADAVADFSEALRIDPSLTRVYFSRARAREKAGDAAGARQDLALAMSETPGDDLGWIDRALARVDADPAAALADLDAALKVNPLSLLALQNKAFILGDRLGRQEETVAVLDREVELYPGFVRGRVGRGVHLARLGRRAEAHADAREALARSQIGETFYQAANIYALTSRQYPEDAGQAFPLLAIALRLGFGLEFVDKDSDFDAVRDHPEFKRIVKAARDLDEEVRKAGR